MPSHAFAMITPHGDPLGRIGEPDIGGQCIYVRELSAHLAKAGHAVSIFTRNRRDGKPDQDEYAPGATVYRIPCGPPGFIPKEELGAHLPEFADAVRSRLSGNEILHSHYWDGGSVVMMLRAKAPWFHTTHSIGKLKQAALPDGEQYRYGERIAIETDTYRGCDRVVALTETEKQQIAELYDVPEERIVVIPPGVNTQDFQPVEDKIALRRELGLPPNAVIVFALGRLDERKGFDLLFEAAARAQAADLPETLYVFSAGDGSAGEAAERAKIERILETNQLEKAVRWIPVIPEADLPRYYAAADVFVLPSRYEPFGIVMLEAMASQIPIIATSAGGPATVIEQERSGLLVDPTDTEAFANALTMLIRSPNTRLHYGERARAAAVAEYSWQAIADRHLVAYEAALEEDRNAR